MARARILPPRAGRGPDGTGRRVATNAVGIVTSFAVATVCLLSMPVAARWRGPSFRPSPPGGREGMVPATQKVILPPAGHEAADVGPRFIAGAFALLTGSLAVVTLGVLWLFPLPSTDRALHTPLPLYPQPRLQPDPRQEMQRFLAAEQVQLATYGWIDRSKGIVRLPIDAAMRLIAQDGIPDWPTHSGQPAAAVAEPAP